MTHLKRSWYWERFKVGGEGVTGWHGWMASLTEWTWVWVNSRIWWWTGRPGMLQSMKSQRFGHGCATELNWTEKNKMMLVRPLHDQVQNDYALSTCSPLPPSIHLWNYRLNTLAHWLSVGVGGRSLNWSMPLHLGAGLWNKANLPFHQTFLYWLWSRETWTHFH